MKLGGWIVMLTVLTLILTLLGIGTGVSSSLSYVGININSATGAIDSVDLENSSFWSALFGAGVGILVILGITGSILIGLFGKGYDVSLVLAPLIISLGAAFVVNFFTIISSVNAMGITWMTSLVSVIFGGLMVGFAMSCVDYFAGR